MATCRLQSSVSHPLCDYVKLGLKMSDQFLNHIVSTQNFYSKKQKLNQSVEISLSVAWPGVGRLGRCTEAEGLAALLGALGTGGLLAIGRGVVCLLSCSIAELILVVMVAGVVCSVWWWGFCALGCRWAGLVCWAVVCFWFGLGNPRPIQECPNIFIRA